MAQVTTRVAGKNDPLYKEPVLMWSSDSIKRSIAGYPDEPLGEQQRAIEDVPSLHAVVLAHFSKDQENGNVDND